MSQLTTAHKARKLATLGSNVLHAYLFDQEGHTFTGNETNLASITGAALVAGPVVLQNVAIANGNFDADDFTFNSVPAGDPCEGVLIVDNTLDEVVGVFDGITVTPNGNNIDITVGAGGFYTQ